MSEESKVIKLRKETNEVQRIGLHAIIADIANTSVLDGNTLPKSRITYDGGPCIKIEYKGDTLYLPVTNAKYIRMK